MRSRANDPSQGSIGNWMKTLRKRSIRKVRSSSHSHVASWLLVPFLCACGAGSKHEAENQVVAKVNGDGITLRELNDYFSRIESRSASDAKIDKMQVLDAVVDERLLVQRSIENGLDREPETIAAVGRARRRVLAQAAIDHATGGAKVSYREISTFYKGHPDLFERRKTYVFRRFDLVAKELQPSLKAELDKAGSSAEVGSILKSANVNFTDHTEIRAAELLPAEVLKRAAEMQNGDILIFRQPSQVVMMQLMKSIPEPVDIARATPSIRAFLSDSRRRNAAASLLKGLRQDAKIEYKEGLIDGLPVQADAGPLDSMEGKRARRDITRITASDSAR